MNKNLKISTGIIVVLSVTLIAFYAGFTYGQGKKTAFNDDNAPRFNGQQNQRAANPQGIKKGNQDINLTAGEIISKDDKSLTVKLNDGGSKIIFLSASTTVSKMVGGDINDLTVGTSISVTGKTNSDGSANASSIQIRPTLPDQPGR